MFFVSVDIPSDRIIRAFKPLGNPLKLYFLVREVKNLETPAFFIFTCNIQISQLVADYLTFLVG